MVPIQEFCDEYLLRFPLRHSCNHNKLNPKAEDHTRLIKKYGTPTREVLLLNFVIKVETAT